MKRQTAFTAGIFLSALAGFAFAKAPEIDSALVDEMVAQVLRQSDQHDEQSHKPDGQEIRKDIVRRLQTLELLKNEALKAGLDKDAGVQNRFKIAQSAFYAEEYVRFLERSTEVSDAELRRFYDAQTRMIKLQHVSFETEKAAVDAQQLLLKGLPFDKLAERFPDQAPAFEDFVTPQQLPEPLASTLADMERGDVTHKPLQVENRYYLFKISEVQRNPEAKPLDEIRTQVVQELKQIKTRKQIDNLLESNGLKP